MHRTLVDPPNLGLPNTRSDKPDVEASQLSRTEPQALFREEILEKEALHRLERLQPVFLQ
jgi:hypothetical protein